MDSVLFVCLGNICRSPAAEGVARRVAENMGAQVRIDSAGTGNWHAGEPPHSTMRLVAKHYGFPIDDLRARQVTSRDFHDFDWIVAMDGRNLSDLQELHARHGGTAKLVRLLEHTDAGTLDVPDPYYGGEDGFHHSFSLIRQGVEGFFTKHFQA